MKTTTLALAAAMAAGTLARAQEAVQWRVEDGGNGHWYQARLVMQDWDDARNDAAANGGYLATVHSMAENDLLLSLVNGEWQDYWLGGFRTDASCSDTAFEWVTGEPFTFTNWLPSDPDCVGWNGPGTGTVIEMIGRPETGPDFGQWSDESPTLYYQGTQIGAYSLFEWSADCNGDGIVDYGQILDGTFADTNANGVPDTCECFADVNQDGVVNGADISAVLGFWGQAGKPLPAADITRDGLVDGADIAVLLGSWGPCQ